MGFMLHLLNTLRVRLRKRITNLFFNRLLNFTLLYCTVSIHLYSASCSAHQSEALPVQETQREESSLLNLQTMMLCDDIWHAYCKQINKNIICNQRPTN